MMKPNQMTNQLHRKIIFFLFGSSSTKKSFRAKPKKLTTDDHPVKQTKATVRKPSLDVPNSPEEKPAPKATKKSTKKITEETTNKKEPSE